MSTSANLATLVILGHITIEEAERIESDVIYRTGNAYAPLSSQVADFGAALTRARNTMVDDTRKGGTVSK